MRPHTIGAKIEIAERGLSGLRSEKTVQVIIVPRHPLAFLPQFAAPLVPAAQSMGDHHLVPKGAGRLDRGHVGDGEINACRFLRDIGRDRDGAIGIERRFRPGLEAYGRSHIGAITRLDLGIPEQQGLTIGIGFVELHPSGAVRTVGKLSGEEVVTWHLNVRMRRFRSLRQLI